VDRDVLVVGESLVDVVRTADGSTREYAGGSAANVAVALARLGRPVRFATSFSDDEHGALLREHIERAGVSFATDPLVVDRTSTALATIGADGAARYTFDLEWRLGPLVEEPEPPLAVHVCSLGAVIEPGCDDVLMLVERLHEDATITYDVNARPAITGTGAGVVAVVERLVALADVVKASDEDLEAFWPDRDHATAATALLDLGPSAVVVTRGAGGATWFGRDLVVEAATEPVVVADTIGAGDTFGAALVDGLWERDLLGGDRRGALADISHDVVAEVLARAVRAAAVTVSRPGADPPYRHELERA
jgi:fructokinase